MYAPRKTQLLKPAVEKTEIAPSSGGGGMGICAAYVDTAGVCGVHHPDDLVVRGDEDEHDPSHP